MPTLHSDHPFAAVEKAVDDYLEHYTFEDDDGSYTPNVNERFVIKDAIMGLLVDDAFRAALGIKR